MKKNKKFIMQFIKNSVMMLIIGIMPACYKKQKKLSPAVQEQKILIIKTAGIECPDCAHLAVDKLKTIKNIESVTFEPTKNYEGGSLIITYHEPLITEEIDTLLRAEGFARINS